MLNLKQNFGRLVLLVVVFIALLIGFRMLLLVHAPVVFNSPSEDLSYGWLVPFFSFYVLWRERKALVASLASPSWWGMLAMVPFMLIGILGVRGIQIRFEILAFAGFCLTIPWAFFGLQTAKRVLFASAFLLFCLPLSSVLDSVTVNLRLLATETAYQLAHGFGAEVVREGTQIFIRTDNGYSPIDIAAPCSGLRSLFAMMALAASFGYFSQPTWLRRGVLFALSIPIAILGNVMRIVFIVVIAALWSFEVAMGAVHDYSGFIIFFFSLALLLGLNSLLDFVFAHFKLLQKVQGKVPQLVQKPTTTTCGKESAWVRLVPWLTALLVVPVMLWQSMTPDAVLTQAPSIVFPQIAGYASEAEVASETELMGLPADTIILRRKYVADNGDVFHVAAVVGGKDKSSIHRPELCLPTQGYFLSAPQEVSIEDRAWQLITIEKGRRHFFFAYTFFNQAGFKTSSHIQRIFRDVLDRSLYNRIDRWVMVTVDAATDDRQRMTAFLKGLFREDLK